MRLQDRDGRLFLNKISSITDKEEVFYIFRSGTPKEGIAKKINFPLPVPVFFLPQLPISSS
jgi:hypothetical protein